MSSRDLTIPPVTPTGTPAAGPVAPTAAHVPEAVAPPPGHPRFPLVDSMRAIAALMVLLTHTAFDSSGFLSPVYGRYTLRLEAGVTVFFLISGFLLYRPFVSARLNGARRPTPLAYGRRRLIRIVPAYWVALTILAALGLVNDVFTSHWWVYYFFLQIYNDNYVLNGIGPAWTLCVEVSFYALLPLYAAFVAWTLTRRPLRDRQVSLELALLALIALASLGLRLWLRENDRVSFWLNALPTHLEWFAAGMAFAVLSASWQGRGRLPPVARWIARHAWVCWVFAAVMFYLAGHLVTGPGNVRIEGRVVSLYGPGDDVRRHVLYGLFAIGLLAPAVIGDDEGGGVRRLLAYRRLAWLGVISYGIYLWHNPLASWICDHNNATGCRFHGVGFLQRHPALYLTVLTLIASVAIAAASYYLVESPLLRFKDRRPRRPRPASSTPA